MKIHKKKVILFIVIVEFLLILLLVKAVFYPSNNQLIKSFYSSTVATLISPHSLRENIEHGTNEFIIVDTREKPDYVDGHIIGSLNISPNGDWIKEFKKLQKENPDKEILIYCYTNVCMRGKKMGRELALNGIYVKELGVGFNNWKNYWKTWNYENEWEHIDINDFIVAGENPGQYYVDPKIQQKKLEEGCSILGEYGC